MTFLKNVQRKDKKFDYRIDSEYLHHIGHGSGGLSMGYQHAVGYKFDLPVSLETVSDIYESNFQFLVTLNRGHALLVMLRRTFTSRIPNPVSRLFIGYPLEPSG